MKKINWGIIGLGKVANKFADGFFQKKCEIYLTKMSFIFLPTKEGSVAVSSSPATLSPHC